MVHIVTASVGKCRSAGVSKNLRFCTRVKASSRSPPPTDADSWRCRQVGLPNYTAELEARLLVYSHLIAAACEYRFRVWNDSLLPYQEVFAGQEKNPCDGFPPRKSSCLSQVLSRLLRRGIACATRLIDRWEGNHLLLSFRHQPDGLEMNLQGSLYWLGTYQWLVLGGSSYRSGNLRQKHAGTVCGFFQLSRF